MDGFAGKKLVDSQYAEPAPSSNNAASRVEELPPSEDKTTEAINDANVTTSCEKQNGSDYIGPPFGANQVRRQFVNEMSRAER